MVSNHSNNSVVIDFRSKTEILEEKKVTSNLSDSTTKGLNVLVIASSFLVLKSDKCAYMRLLG